MRHYRFVIVVLLLWLIAHWAVRTYICIGWLIPLRVASSSMAPSLLGPNAQKQCPHCLEQLIIDATRGVPDTAICYNCGNRLDSFRDARLRSGSRIIIDRWTARCSGAQRYDIVAFTTTEPKRKWVTKRIVGLPGETISIVDGDIWVNGHCAQKNVAQFVDSAIEVHVGRDIPPDVTRPSLIPRWKESRWNTVDKRWIWTASSQVQSTVAEPSAEGLDWLDYHHRCSPQVVIAPKLTGHILDEYAYNQSDSRPLHDVQDFACTATIRVRGTGRIVIQLQTPAGRVQARLGTDSRPKLSLNEQEIYNQDSNPTPIKLRKKLRLLIGYWDQQVVFRLGDSLEFRYPITPRPEPPATDRMSVEAAYFSIGTQGNESVSMSDWTLWRDLHYYADLASGTNARFTLTDDQYVLLGDNTARSTDARASVDDGIIPRDRILGIVTRVK